MCSHPLWSRVNVWEIVVIVGIAEAHAMEGPVSSGQGILRDPSCGAHNVPRKVHELHGRCGIRHEQVYAQTIAPAQEIASTSQS